MPLRIRKKVSDSAFNNFLRKIENHPASLALKYCANNLSDYQIQCMSPAIPTGLRHRLGVGSRRAQGGEGDLRETEEIL
jgi:hypothetical protein